MNEEQIKIAAKEFCEAEQVDSDQQIFNWGMSFRKDSVPLDEVLSKFTQSLIAKGFLVEMSEVNKSDDHYKMSISLQSNRIKELEKEVQQHRDNAFKKIQQYGNWISVNDTLPTKDGSYLVSIQNTGMPGAHFVLTTFTKAWGFIDSRGLFWMPLPTAPAESNTAAPVKEATDQDIDEKAKDFKIWCDNQVIHGRTTHKLFLDWKESKIGTNNN